MRVQDLQLEVRPRQSWEAVDLGFYMVRHHARAIWASWFAVTGPIALLILLVLWNHPGWSFVVLIWLKPLLDRIPIHVLSQAIFGEVPGVRDTWRSLPRLLRGGLFTSLFFIRRLSLARAMMLPVFMLEGLRGHEFRMRWSALRRVGGGSAWVTGLVGIVFEQILFWGTLLLLSALVPTESGFSLWEWIFSSPPESLGGVRFCFLLGYLVVSLMEPFFAGAGFALYINRRTHLEAWDVELAFRRMAKRLSGISAGAVLLITLGFGTMSLGAQGLGTSRSPLQQGVESTPVDPPVDPPIDDTAAEDSEPVDILDSKPKAARNSLEDTHAKQEISKVMKDPVFGEEKLTRRLRWKRTSEPDRPSRGRAPLFEWMGMVAAPLLKGIAIGVLVFGLGWLLWHFRGHFGGLHWRRRSHEDLESLFGLDIRPESLPKDLPSTAWRLWQSGQHRAAMALLYRGCLACLVHHHHVELHPGSTEGDCLRLSRPTLEASAWSYFGELSSAWLRTAYAEAPPEDAHARELCVAWGRHFHAGPEGTT